MSTWFLILSQFSIIAFALVGGVFLAFSDFIMRSLATAQSPAGIEVMQSINREVFRWVFMTLFLGMAVVSAGIIVYTYSHLAGIGAVLIGGAAGLYLLGVFGVTVAFNVPLNNLLEALDFRSAAAVDFWKARYLPHWTFWNSVRSVASIGAAVMALVGLVLVVQG
ncbi:DUF1772 domain-containing protein [Bauldia litoralis]|uniref:anthrone oxygenase family protein n=1 Tax=Bauldia litoralis TaxID=665467 RepID=UPI0032679ED2